MKIIEDEIDQIIDNPLIGERKKDNLAYLRVHKFRLNELTVLLGYSWVANKVELYLLHIEAHENFYDASEKTAKD